MKKLLLTTAALTAFATAQAEDVKIGVILGFTGPIESLTPAMGDAAEAAMAEVNASGKFTLGNVVPVRGDSTCVDAAAASAAAERLITSDGVKAIMGADCSGVTGAILQNVARANGVVMISPSATSPALSEAEDDGLFFRTAPSDARQGVIIAETLKDRGINSVAISYTNNDYGKGLADATQAAIEEMGGEVTLVAAHEDGKADYSAEVGALASAGGEALIVAGYLDQGGRGVIQASLDAGAFDIFVLPDGMVGESLTEALGEDINGSFGQVPGSDSEGAGMLVKLGEDGGFDGAGQYAPESYDAAALILMAMQAAGSTDSADFKDKIMDIANAPGEKIMPGELGKALEILAEGGDVDYVGASAVEFIEGGESAGSFREVEVQDGKFETIGYR